MLKDLGKNLSRAGLVVTVAEGINDVSKEKGAGHKAQRATAVFVEDAVKVTPGILASEGAVTMAGGIVETGGLIVVPAVAGALIKLDADTIIDGKRLYEKADNASQPDKAHSNLIGQERELASTLKDMGVTYDKKGNVDLTVGSNRQKLQRALHDTHDKLAHVIESNDGLLLRDAPLWRGKQLTNFNEAKIELGSVDAAIADLGEVRAQMAANKHAKAQHVKADDTVTHGLHKQPQIKQENAGIAKA
jgi:hypothetical protein